MEIIFSGNEQNIDLPICHHLPGLVVPAVHFLSSEQRVFDLVFHEKPRNPWFRTVILIVHHLRVKRRFRGQNFCRIDIRNMVRSDLPPMTGGANL